ncbi:putative absent in melanoma 1 protein isoform X1 [Sesbania bispinosa]|nr:putative absent in melanoma 1 protein isoform X1 [Sesbania bispinosa]
MSFPNNTFLSLNFELNRFLTSLFGNRVAFLGDFLVFEDVGCSFPDAFCGEVISFKLFDRLSLALADEQGMVHGFLVDGLEKVAGIG